jgi:hypothetical protein
LESTTIGWNPDKFVWGGGYLDAVEQTAQGIGVVGDWSTGNRTGGVTRGDRVFLLRQGTQGRGIIASGTVLKDISWTTAYWRARMHKELMKALGG